MTVGMAFQKGIILELVITTSYVYSYGFLPAMIVQLFHGNV
jgi:hypothetical protein